MNINDIILSKYQMLQFVKILNYKIHILSIFFFIKNIGYKTILERFQPKNNNL